MSSGIIETIKIAALDVIDASNPVIIEFGTVTKINPLEISINASKTLGEGVLKLTRNVTDYNFEMTVDHTTESHSHTHSISDTYSGGGSASTETHNHSYTGKKKFKVHNALKVGETVIMLRMQGGQSYVVLDRVVRK